MARVRVHFIDCTRSWYNLAYFTYWQYRTLLLWHWNENHCVAGVFFVRHARVPEHVVLYVQLNIGFSLLAAGNCVASDLLGCYGTCESPSFPNARFSLYAIIILFFYSTPRCRFSSCRFACARWLRSMNSACLINARLHWSYYIGILSTTGTDITGTAVIARPFLSFRWFGETDGFRLIVRVFVRFSTDGVL